MGVSVKTVEVCRKSGDTFINQEILDPHEIDILIYVSECELNKRDPKYAEFLDNFGYEDEEYVRDKFEYIVHGRLATYYKEEEK